jgi:hypothetical protein
MLTAADLPQVKNSLRNTESEEHAKLIDEKPAPNASPDSSPLKFGC